MTPNKNQEDLHILAVDDDSFMLEIIECALHNIGIERVVTTQEAAEALNLIIEDNIPPFDIILCDLNMPGMDGIEFVMELAVCGFEGSFAVISGADDSMIQSAELLSKGNNIKFLGGLKKPATEIDLRGLLANRE